MTNEIGFWRRTFLALGHGALLFSGGLGAQVLPRARGAVRPPPFGGGGLMALPKDCYERGTGSSSPAALAPRCHETQRSACSSRPPLPSYVENLPTLDGKFIINVKGFGGVENRTFRVERLRVSRTPMAVSSRGQLFEPKAASGSVHPVQGPRELLEGLTPRIYGIESSEYWHCRRLMTDSLEGLSASRTGEGDKTFSERDLLVVHPPDGEMAALIKALHGAGLEYASTTIIGKTPSRFEELAAKLERRGVSLPLGTAEDAFPDESSREMAAHAVAWLTQHRQRGAVEDSRCEEGVEAALERIHRAFPDRHDEVIAEAIDGWLAQYATKVREGGAKKHLLVLDATGKTIELAKKFPELLRRIWVLENVHRSGPVRDRDSHDLAEQCRAATALIRKRFSPENSIREAKPGEPERMPLVDAVIERFPLDHFSECDVLAVQHLYSQTVAMIDAMHRRGLEYTATTVIGKAYSTNYEAARALVDRGVRVPLDTLEQDATRRHEEVMSAAIEKQLSLYLQAIEEGRAKPRLLVLDEGGKAIELIHHKFPSLLDRVVAVEQTTKGAIRIQQLAQLGCPIVDVARSDLKLVNEPELVALSIYKAVRWRLAHLAQRGLVGNPLKLWMPGGDLPISILGGGAVGRAVAWRYYKQWKAPVRLFDLETIDPDSLPPSATVITDRSDFLRAAQILISCTGSANALEVGDYKLLPDRAVLFNAASSNDELSAPEVIAAARYDQPSTAWWSDEWKEDKKAYVDSLPDLLADREYLDVRTGRVLGEFGDAIIFLGHYGRQGQRDRVLRFADKEIYLAKNGFVINLTDGPDPIPPKYIQLTRAALVAACGQALHRAGERCLAPLSRELQDFIQEKYDGLLHDALPPGDIVAFDDLKIGAVYFGQPSRGCSEAWAGVPDRVRERNQQARPTA